MASSSRTTQPPAATGRVVEDPWAVVESGSAPYDPWAVVELPPDLPIIEPDRDAEVVGDGSATPGKFDDLLVDLPRSQAGSRPVFEIDDTVEIIPPPAGVQVMPPPQLPGADYVGTTKVGGWRVYAGPDLKPNGHPTKRVEFTGDPPVVSKPGGAP